MKLNLLFRGFVLGLCGGLCGVAAWAQQIPLSDLEQATIKTQTDWFRMASDLDVRVARMLPCAAGATAAIEDVNKASAARMTALANYIKAVSAQAAQDVAMSRQIQQAETALMAGVGTERTDTEQERAAIETQIANLAESVRKKISLSAASDELKALESSVRQRANLITTKLAETEGSAKRFEDLSAALESREAALRKQMAAVEEERIRWNGFYAARLARARVECTASGMGR
jgi:hypothetical protein